MVAIAIPLCLVGVSLITQPSILGFRKSQQRNIWGIVFASGQVHNYISSLYPLIFPMNIAWWRASLNRLRARGSMPARCLGVMCERQRQDLRCEIGYQRGGPSSSRAVHNSFGNAASADASWNFVHGDYIHGEANLVACQFTLHAASAARG